MKTRTVTVDEGEDCGPVDWTTPDAQLADHRFGEKARSQIVATLKLAEERIARGESSDVEVTTDGGWPRIGWHRVLGVRLYDGWPYWRPLPAVLRTGTLGGAWWDFFSSLTEARDVRR